MWCTYVAGEGMCRRRRRTALYVSLFVAYQRAVLGLRAKGKGGTDEPTQPTLAAEMNYEEAEHREQSLRHR